VWATGQRTHGSIPDRHNIFLSSPKLPEWLLGSPTPYSVVSGRFTPLLMVRVTKLSTHVSVVLIFRMGGTIPPLPLYALMVCTGMKMYIYRPCFSVGGLINLHYHVCYGIYALKDDFVMLHGLEI